MIDKYTLNAEGKPVCEPDLLTWARWFETADRKIDHTMIGHTLISTVFLGLDHSFRKSSNPLLYETMIFGGQHDQYQKRYANREEALTGHATAVKMVEEAHG